MNSRTSLAACVLILALCPWLAADDAAVQTPADGVRYRVALTVEMKTTSSVSGLSLAMPAPKEWPTQKQIRQIALEFPRGFDARKRKRKEADYFLFSSRAIPGNSNLKFTQTFECVSYPFSMPAKRLDIENVSPKFLEPEPNIECSEKSLRLLARRIAGVTDDDVEKARRIHRWVKVNIAYKDAPNPDCKATEVLSKRSGDCVAQSTLAVAMLRAARVPARIVAGYVPRGPGSLHVWIEFYGKGFGWLPTDPAMGYFCKLPPGFIIMSKGSHIELIKEKPLAPHVFQIYNACWQHAAQAPKFNYSVSVQSMDQ